MNRCKVTLSRTTRRMFSAASMVLITIMMTACGVARVTEPQVVAGEASGPSAAADPGPLPARLEVAKVYFVKKGKLDWVYRPLNLPPETAPNDVIDLVLRELRKGPTQKEKELGYTSFVSSIAPPGRRDMVVSIINLGVATIDIGIDKFASPTSSDELNAVAQLLFSVIDARPRTGAIRLTFQAAPIRQPDGSEVSPPPTPIVKIPTEIRDVTPEVIYPEYFPCLGTGDCKSNASTNSTVPGETRPPTTPPAKTVPPFLVTTIPVGPTVQGPTVPSPSSPQTSTPTSTPTSPQTSTPTSIAQNPSRIVPTGLRTTGNFFSVAPGSSKGRTSGFGPENGGSNPSPGTLMKRRRT
jgi:hypothetical protein